MDFVKVHTRVLDRGPNKKKTEIYPDFVVGRSKDIMIRGGSFYALWDEEVGLWTTDEYDVQRLVDKKLDEAAAALSLDRDEYVVRYLQSFNTNGWSQFRSFMRNVSDNSKPLDETLVFANTPVKKSDYVSRRLPYNLEEGDYSAWDEMVGTLYNPEERAKIEWFIGSIVSGDSKKLQKFLVIHGPGGTGKSTIMHIVKRLFDGYTASFDAKALVGNNNSFATEIFKSNPLVAIQHDGDLSRIEDNSKLNSIISHEEMTMNEKFKASYTSRINAILIMGTNKPVKITDARSGIIRRLIDVHPTGKLLKPNHYNALLSRIDFELGAIAYHCLQVYREMGKNYYNSYRPLKMMLSTDIFYNFAEANYDIFKSQDGVSLKQAYSMYKAWCNDTGIEHVMPQYKFRDEMQVYFDEYLEKFETHRGYFRGFNSKHFSKPKLEKEKPIFSLVMDETKSLLDNLWADQPAQYAKDDGTPEKRWSEVTTTLKDLDTSKLHYVKPPENHIVIDFDLKGEGGGKSLERNLGAASLWPATYSELSKSGSGIHLHYLWTGGEPSRLDPNYAEGIEVKSFGGGSSLRRLPTRSNAVPINSLGSGLALKEKKVLQQSTIRSEKGLRDMVARNLRKEIHPGTKPSIDFIKHILDEAYTSGVTYDLTDMRNNIVAFANNSTHQPLVCLNTVQQMKFRSNGETNMAVPPWDDKPKEDARLVFFDVEVYPNLFVVVWKYQGGDKVVMINPTPEKVEELFQFKLVGFNNRRYDNHILWGRYLGMTNEQLYTLSQGIIENKPNCMFGEAYNLSYADIYDFSSVKQGLKKFQIDLGIHHMELPFPWDQPVPEEQWPRVVEYCGNDVDSTEAVFEARKADFVARQILAELSGLTVNDTTQKHTAKIIFGDDRNPQRDFIYTDLSKMFPGYRYEKGVSTYRGETVGEGGYVYAEPGMYENVALLDVASMHPTSISLLNLFGVVFTRRFGELTKARLAIKRKAYGEARTLLDGALGKYLGSPEDSKALADALKIVINIVYGLTSAKFDNPFRDHRNKDNIVAKRGALFMIDLKHFVQEKGFDVAHIKTDSIKIPNATPEIIADVMEFGKKYGYTFEHEATYDKFCLVNDAVYIARKGDQWTAVGAQFQHPYVFKTLFARDQPITFDDLCETKSVSKGAMYLDFEHDRAMPLTTEEMRFVGRTGRFTPVKPSANGAVLYRVSDGKKYAVTGTKGHLWLESEMAKDLDKSAIDYDYFEKLVSAAESTIDYYGPFAEFVR